MFSIVDTSDQNTKIQAYTFICADRLSQQISYTLWSLVIFTCMNHLKLWPWWQQTVKRIKMWY